MPEMKVAFSFCDHYAMVVAAQVLKKMEVVGYSNVSGQPIPRSLARRTGREGALCYKLGFHPNTRVYIRVIPQWNGEWKDYKIISLVVKTRAMDVRHKADGHWDGASGPLDFFWVYQIDPKKNLLELSTLELKEYFESVRVAVPVGTPVDRETY